MGRIITVLVTLALLAMLLFAAETEAGTSKASPHRVDDDRAYQVAHA
jgi:hypothetical protein